jgi:hypothetical protein
VRRDPEFVGLGGKGRDQQSARDMQVHQAAGISEPPGQSGAVCALDRRPRPSLC